MPSSEDVNAARETRLRFLSELYDLEEAGHSLPQVDMIASKLGIKPDDWSAIERITSPLEADGLIDGIATNELGLVRVKLTSRGRQLVEDRVSGDHRMVGPASIGDVRIEGSGNTININQHSPGAEQTAYHFEASDLRRITEWIDDVERRFPAEHASDADRDDVQANVTELRSELAKPAPDHTKIRRLGRAIVRILEGTSASLASAGLLEMGHAIFTNM